MFSSAWEPDSGYLHFAFSRFSVSGHGSPVGRYPQTASRLFFVSPISPVEVADQRFLKPLSRRDGNPLFYAMSSCSVGI